MHIYTYTCISNWVAKLPSVICMYMFVCTVFWLCNRSIIDIFYIPLARTCQSWTDGQRLWSFTSFLFHTPFLLCLSLLLFLFSSFPSPLPLCLPPSFPSPFFPSPFSSSFYSEFFFFFTPLLFLSFSSFTLFLFLFLFLFLWLVSSSLFLPLFLFLSDSSLSLSLSDSSLSLHPYFGSGSAGGTALLAPRASASLSRPSRIRTSFTYRIQCCVCIYYIHNTYESDNFDQTI